MPDWCEGYIADVGYLHGFCRELTPARLGLAALAAGNRGPDPARPMSYCELGCGQGFSTNLLAAANPHIRFHGFDFNPGHIAAARRLAEEAGTPNVTFHDLSFAEAVEAPDLPAFDVVGLHGVYSWVPAERRREIVTFLRRRLKPGGFVYVSYNCMPGWAGAAPARHLMRLHARRLGGPSASQVGPAFEFLERLRATGGAYFEGNAALASFINTLKGLDHTYLAHELLNEVWDLLHHSDVVADLAEAKLGFLGSADVLDHVISIHVTDEQQQILDEIPDPVLRETARDAMTNQNFRRDLFAKGVLAHSTASSRAEWRGLRLALTMPRETVQLRVTGKRGTFELHEEIYEPLLDALAEGPATIAALMDARPVDWAQLMQAVAVMVGAGWVEPCLPAEGEAERAAGTRAFNEAVMRRAHESADLLWFASPVTGGGVPVDRLSQLLLAGEAAGRDPVDHAWETLSEQNECLLRDGKALTTPAENRAELGHRLQALAERRGVLRQLGVA